MSVSDTDLFAAAEAPAERPSERPSERPPKLTEAQIRAALRARYKPPEYAYFDEVSNGTGGMKTGAADAIAMSVWPSRGLELHGFEIKVSRADWLRELKNPAKSERVLLQCDRWYLVVGDVAIVGAGELPPTWGLMVPRGRVLVVHKEAPKLEAKPVTRALLASLLRRASEPQQGLVEAAVRRALEERDAAWKPARDYQLANAERTAEHWKAEAERLKQAIRDFEEASGVSLAGHYQTGRIGKAVAMVTSGLADDYQRQLTTIRNQLAGLQRAVERTLADAEEERIER